MNIKIWVKSYNIKGKIGYENHNNRKWAYRAFSRVQAL